MVAKESREGGKGDLREEDQREKGRLGRCIGGSLRGDVITVEKKDILRAIVGNGKRMKGSMRRFRIVK